MTTSATVNRLHGAVEPLDYNHPTVALLIAQYGPLLRHEDVAQLLHRHAGALRDMLARQPDQPHYRVLRAAVRRVGRTTLYDPRYVAQLLQP